MKLVKAALLFAVSGFGGLTAVSQVLNEPSLENPVVFDLMHTRQNCKWPAFQPTFCVGRSEDPSVKSDQKEATELSGMVDKIGAQIARATKSPNPKLAEIFIAYFSFSNKLVHEHLCEAIAAGVKTTVVLDRGSTANIADLEKNKKCADAKFKPKVIYLGGLTAGKWRLHHNKFLYVDPADGSGVVNLNASSGNLSAFGTSLHMDHWLTMKALKDSNVSRSHQCVMKGLLAASKEAEESGGHNVNNDEEVVREYLDARDECFVQDKVIPVDDYEKSLKKEKVAMFYSPNEYNEVSRAFLKEIGRVRAQGKKGYIYIAIQHFLNPGIGNALIQASNSGVDVRIIMDNDVVTESGEVKGVLDFLKNLKADAPKIMVRYIETNSLAGGNGSMMHNKFALLNGQRVFSGAGQYTTAALRKNWENFALTEDKDLSAKFGRYFKTLWELSVDDLYVIDQLKTHEENPLSKEPKSPINFPMSEAQFHPKFVEDIEN